MEKIHLINVLPHVFLQAKELKSEVWEHELSFEKGKVYLVEAVSGKGKSTLCSYLIGYRDDYSGKLLFDDEDTKAYKAKDWGKARTHALSYLFQELRLFPELTAYENVEIKNKLTHFKSKEQIRELFRQLEIEDKRDQKVGLMSFGQQQRVAMIRALAQPFDFIIADEPVSHLDDRNARIMGEIMLQEARNQGAGVIVTSIGKHMDFNYDKTLKL